MRSTPTSFEIFGPRTRREIDDIARQLGEACCLDFDRTRTLVWAASELVGSGVVAGPCRIRAGRVGFPNYNRDTFQAATAFFAVRVHTNRLEECSLSIGQLGDMMLATRSKDAAGLVCMNIQSLLFQKPLKANWIVHQLPITGHAPPNQAGETGLVQPAPQPAQVYVWGPYS